MEQESIQEYGKKREASWPGAYSQDVILRFNSVDVHKVFRQRIRSLCSEFEAIFGIQYNIDFSVIKSSGLDTVESRIPLSPNASVSYNDESSDITKKNFRILFTETLIDEICKTFNVILNSEKTLPQIGESFEIENGNQKEQKPKNLTRIAYAAYLKALTLEFVFYHEFCHICFGHLHNLFVEYGQYSLNAARRAQPKQARLLTRTIKLYELDADVNALVFLINQYKNDRPSLYTEWYRPHSLEDFFFSLGLALTIFFRMIESWRREEDPVYSARYTDHPHPDIRDSIITAYIRVNANEDTDANRLFHQAYDRGREEAINIIADLDYFISTFEITTDLGHAEAVKELDWLSEELNALKNSGVSNLDLRVLHRNLRKTK